MIVPFMHRALTCALLVLSVTGARAQQSDAGPLQSSPNDTLSAASIASTGTSKTLAPVPAVSPSAPPALHEEIPNPDGNAALAAVADGLTTSLAISAGAVEVNPLLNPSPAGILTVTALKFGLTRYAQTLPEEEKRTVLKSTTSFWGGAAVNNLLVAIAAPTPLAVVAGVVAGVLAWRHMESQYVRQDEMLAQQRMLAAPVQMAAGDGSDSQTQVAATELQQPQTTTGDSSGR